MYSRPIALRSRILMRVHPGAFIDYWSVIDEHKNRWPTRGFSGFNDCISNNRTPMKPFRIVLLLVLASSSQTSFRAADFKFQDQTLTVPDGFEVERVAGPPNVNRPIVADFDERGRLYVADSSG